MFQTDKGTMPERVGNLELLQIFALAAFLVRLEQAKMDMRAFDLPADPIGPSSLAPALEEVGLRYVSDQGPGIERRRTGKSFSYRGPKGEIIRDSEKIRWIKSLAIPPAWEKVWISPNAEGHILATGRDAKGRKQYRYHPRWRQMRDEAKFHHVVAFARALPRIRAAVDADLRRRNLDKRKVVALVVRFLEATLIRVGNDEYRRSNKTFGLTTMRSRHLRLQGTQLRFRFRGKGGKDHEVTVRSRRLAKLVQTLQELPGQELFTYVDRSGDPQPVESADVNAYLREVGEGDFTAKDFRTWAATVLAALALCEFESFDSKAAAKRNVTRAIERVAGRLGNTPTIAKKSYVHPEVLSAYLDGSLVESLRGEIERELSCDIEGLQPEEAVVLAFLRDRLSRVSAQS